MNMTPDTETRLYAALTKRVEGEDLVKHIMRAANRAQMDGYPHIARGFLDLLTPRNAQPIPKTHPEPQTGLNVKSAALACLAGTLAGVGFMAAAWFGPFYT